MHPSVKQQYQINPLQQTFQNAIKLRPFDRIELTSHKLPRVLAFKHLRTCQEPCTDSLTGFLRKSSTFQEKHTALLDNTQYGTQEKRSVTIFGKIMLIHSSIQGS